MKKPVEIPGKEIFEKDSKFYYEEDQVLFEYDPEKSAWFPVIDDTLFKQQQSVYGTATKRKRKNYTSEPVKKEKKRINSSVYVSGLPVDATKEELSEMFSRFGLIMQDDQGQPKIKFYLDEQGNPKGDALIIYFKPESVQLAITMLDDTLFRPESSERIKVQMAEFSQDKPLPAKPTVKKAAVILSKKLNWDEEEDEKLRFLILRHMFTLEELEKDPTLLLDLKEDVRDECLKYGTVTNVTLFDLEPEGIMSIKFKKPEDASACQKAMDGRWFGGRQVVAELASKKPKFKQSKGEEEGDERRLENYTHWLESESKDSLDNSGSS